MDLKAKELKGEWEKNLKTRNFTVLFFTKYYYGDQIKECELVGMSERIRSRGRPRIMYEYSRGRSVNGLLFRKICIDLPV